MMESIFTFALGAVAVWGCIIWCIESSKEN